VIGVTAVLGGFWPADSGSANAAAAGAGLDALGLPDGRVYEQVSPADKHGNYVASGGAEGLAEGEGYSSASADGNALVFLGSGAMGSSVSGVLGPYVARRSPSGWTTTSATPPQIGLTSVFGSPVILVPSRDFARFAFGSINAGTRYAAEEPEGPFHSLDLYLSEDAFVQPAWLGRPTITNAAPQPGYNSTNELTIDFGLAGASPALSTVYFAYSGTLVAEDEGRAPNAGDGTGRRATAPWGFYEWNSGTLASAGVLPAGSPSPFGAVPADVAGDLHHERGSSWQAADFNNEVSLDGTRAFFVSPDPAASTVTNAGECESEGPCTSTAPELYVRENAPGGGRRTVLVSQSQLAGHVGEPAPTGPVSVVDTFIHGGPVDSTDVYAAPDGSQAFFASTDRLTEAAPENTNVKEYAFDLETEKLTYLPEVLGPIVASSRNGSDFIFENTASTPARLDLWSEGANGGHVTTIAELPKPADIGQPYNGVINIEARASADGSVFAFDTNAPIPGGFNNQEGFGEVYRYAVETGTLLCVSCFPVGQPSSGNARISYDDGGGLNAKPRSTVDTRVISSDGTRVFFDTPDPLVPQDTNGKRDVYEWEAAGSGSCTIPAGCIYLISSGKGAEGSFYLDNSESGNDVFFNTTDGLVANDRDGAYDAYDARTPHPEDERQTPPVFCQAEGCRSSSPEPPLVLAPASATVMGSGNVVPSATTAPKSATRVQKLAQTLRACRRKHKARARHRCEAAARHRYGLSRDTQTERAHRSRR
jgi:hypothetical protein